MTFRGSKTKVAAATVIAQDQESGVIRVDSKESSLNSPIEKPRKTSSPNPQVSIKGFKLQFKNKKHEALLNPFTLKFASTALEGFATTYRQRHHGVCCLKLNGSILWILASLCLDWSIKSDSLEDETSTGVLLTVASIVLLTGVILLLGLLFWKKASSLAIRFLYFSFTILNFLLCYRNALYLQEEYGEIIQNKENQSLPTQYNDKILDDFYSLQEQTVYAKNENYILLMFFAVFGAADICFLKTFLFVAINFLINFVLTKATHLTITTIFTTVTTLLLLLLLLWITELNEKFIFWRTLSWVDESTRRSLRSEKGSAGPKDVRHISGKNITTSILIGKGGFGNIYKGVFNGEDVAIKKLITNRHNEGSQEYFFKEMEIMAAVSHPNIIFTYGGCWKEGIENTFLVMEYAEKGSFTDILQNNEFTWKNARRQILLGVAKAMSHLHHGLDRPLIHRDLKPANILVTSSMEAKLTDFGTARYIPFLNAKPKDLCMLTQDVGTPLFMAPEILKHEFYNEKADVYSFGLILLEALVGNGTYLINMHKTNKGGANASQHGKPVIPKSTRVGNQRLVEIIESCLDDIPTERPTFIQILDNLNERMEVCNSEITKTPSAYRSSLGRSFSASTSDGAEMAALVVEMQEELRNKIKEYESKLESQAEDYESRLQNMASAIL